MSHDNGISHAKGRKRRERWIIAEVPLTERQWAHLRGMGDELVSASGNGEHLNEGQRVGAALNTLVDLWLDLQAAREGATVQ